jgi:hypothetical protein
MAAKGRGRSAAEEDTAPDVLFRAPPHEFVALRNGLAKEAVQKGDKRQAEILRNLPRPSLAVWATNQVAREEPRGIEALLQSAERVRREQAKALRGPGGSAEELRAASGELRRTLAELVKAAAEVLARGGQQPSATLLRRVEATLQSIAIGSGTERDALKKGRLTREIQEFGFPPISGAFRVKAEPKRVKPASGEARTRAATRRQEIAAAAVGARLARRSADALLTDARKALGQAARMAKRAADAEEVAADRRSEARAAEQRAADLKREAEGAAQRLAVAEQKILALRTSH